MKAIYNGKTIAESNETIVIEGNHYFPPNSINKEYFEEATLNTTCPWKGLASYYDVVVDGKRNKEAAWYYKSPSALAKSIKDHVAFWRGIEITE